MPSAAAGRELGEQLVGLLPEHGLPELAELAEKIAASVCGQPAALRHGAQPPAGRDFPVMYRVPPEVVERMDPAE